MPFSTYSHVCRIKTGRYHAWSTFAAVVTRGELCCWNVTPYSYKLVYFRPKFVITSHHFFLHIDHVKCVHSIHLLFVFRVFFFFLKINATVAGAVIVNICLHDSIRSAVQWRIYWDCRCPPPPIWSEILCINSYYTYTSLYVAIYSQYILRLRNIK